MTEFSITRRSMTKLGLAVLTATICAGVPAHARAFASHGYWVASQQRLDGEWVTTAQAEFKDGAIAAIVLSSRGIRFRFQDKENWDLLPGQKAVARIWVDGDGYKGTAEAVNRSEYQTGDLALEFLKTLIQGDVARVELDGTTWTLDLGGLKETLRDALRRYDRFR
jgi:hypothetical protein